MRPADPSRDPIAEGLARGWRVVDGRQLERDAQDEADVLIIGTGAGGGIAAERLTRAGLKVILVEEGPLKSSRDFKMREAEAYPQLYQESAARKTADKAINILQGRAVGGSTTVNWTSSFRTPPDTLAHWQRHHGLAGHTVESLAPWFEKAEAMVGIGDWPVPPNANNEALRTGGRKLGIEVQAIRRNVRGCWNLGYCGLGCPTNAKQSMLVTTIPAALDRGATLYHGLRAEKLVMRGDRIDHLVARAMDAAGLRSREVTVTLRARHVVLAAGAIGSPALLLRSALPDPHQLVGTRTFLHPTVVSAALMPDRVDGHAGAPQTLYSDHFLHTQPPEGPMGFKLESAPLHPVLYATTLHGFGEPHAALMQAFPHAQVLLALMRDGFHPESPGGRVRLRGDGTPELDYPLNTYFFDAARRALKAMAQIQFEAGAREVTAVHEAAGRWTSWAQAERALDTVELRPHRLRVVSAHVMGGCAMGGEARQGVARPDGRHHQVENLSIADGSLFPTSLGANPQLSIYGLVSRQVEQLLPELG
jgi:choline dehydrogenase-like flavoprotein